MITVVRIETRLDFTPEEADKIPQILRDLNWRVQAVGEASFTPGDTAEEAHAEHEVTPEMVRRLLTFRPLHDNQKGLLGALYQADDWISANDIAAEIGIPRKALTGVMGGFGLRAKAVRGWPYKRHGVRPTRFLWDHERRDREDFYRITPALRQAIQDLSIVKKNGR
jgi:hypothetical protein